MLYWHQSYYHKHYSTVEKKGPNKHEHRLSIRTGTDN